MDKTKKLSAIILVAGRGKRISKYTNKPKCLLNIQNQSILERNIKFLNRINIKKIYIVVGYKSTLIKNETKKIISKSNILFVYNKKYLTNGNCYSLKLGLKKIKDDAIYIDGDVVYNEKILQNYVKNKNLNSILIGNGDKKDVECAKVFGSQNLVKRIIEKRIFHEDNYKFLGEAIGINKISKSQIKKFLKISNKIFKNKKNLNLNWDTFYDRYFVNKLPIKYFKSNNNEWVEIDTYEDFKKAKKIIK